MKQPKFGDHILYTLCTQAGDYNCLGFFWSWRFPILVSFAHLNYLFIEKHKLKRNLTTVEETKGCEVVFYQELIFVFRLLTSPDIMFFISDLLGDLNFLSRPLTEQPYCFNPCNTPSPNHSAENGPWCQTRKRHCISYKFTKTLLIKLTRSDW